MSYTHTKTYSVTSSGGGAPISGSFADVGAQQLQGQITIPAGTTNQQITIALTAANLQSVYLICDKGCVIKTNSTSSPGNTITLPPGTPLVWGISETFYSDPFTTNVTCWYVTTTVAATLQWSILTS